MMEISAHLTLGPWGLLIIEAILRTTRMVAVVAGGIVLIDSFAPEHRAPADRRRNARAWAWVAAGALFGGVLTLYATYGTREPRVDVNVARMILWVGLANGLVMRSAAMAERPRWVWFTALLIGATGLVVSLIDALII